MTPRHQVDEERIVAELGVAMLHKLAARRHYGHWQSTSLESLAERFGDETCELFVEFKRFLEAETPEERRAAAEALVNEAADCANFLAMMIDNVNAVVGDD